jgi:glucokinase
VSETEAVIAVDVGGTGMKCALVDAEGTVLHRLRRPTRADRGPAAVVETILDTAAELAGTPGFRPTAAGIAVPGVVDDHAGVARYSANIGWRDVPLRDLAAARLGLPAALGHDVRAGALAEAVRGGGRRGGDVLFVAIGTGIAAAHVRERRVVPGSHFAAGELGHVVVRPDGPACGCGRRGCLEAIASAGAIERRYRAATGTRADAAAIAAAVGTDATAARLWADAVDALADGLLTAIALLDPGTVVIGGGLAQAGPVLLGPLRSALAERATFHTLPEVVRAELGDWAGCVGAALLALGHERREASCCRR